jgi:hypothetical protein
MRTLLNTVTEVPEMRIVRMWPNEDWTRIWMNVHEAPVTATVKVTWYKAIHDLLPTHERLHKIRLAPTDRWGQCNEDTLTHRLTDCGEGPQIWEWTCRCIAAM